MKKNRAAIALAKARSASLTPERRQEIARKAAAARLAAVGGDASSATNSTQRGTANKRSEPTQIGDCYERKAGHGWVRVVTGLYEYDGMDWAEYSEFLGGQPIRSRCRVVALRRWGRKITEAKARSMHPDIANEVKPRKSGPIKD